MSGYIIITVILVGLAVLIAIYLQKECRCLSGLGWGGGIVEECILRVA